MIRSKTRLVLGAKYQYFYNTNKKMYGAGFWGYIQIFFTRKYIKLAPRTKYKYFYTINMKIYEVGFQGQV